MAHWRSFIEKDYLGAWSLFDPQTGKPREVNVEIVRAAGELLKTTQTPKGKRKLVLRLRGGDGKEIPKGFVVNTTNAQTIASMYGDDVDAWKGKRITLYVGKARNPDGGEPVPAIRVRPRPPTGATSDLSDVPVDEAIRKQQSEAFDNGPREPGQEG